MKKYRISTPKDGGFGTNENGRGIDFIPGKLESIRFVNQCRKKVIELWGVGASLDTIGTSFGIQFRFKNRLRNLRAIRLLTTLVQNELDGNFDNQKILNELNAIKKFKA